MTRWCVPRRQSVPARLAEAADAAERLPKGRAALPRSCQRRPRPRPSACRASPSRRSTSAGRPTRRWPPAAPREFPSDARRDHPDGALDQLHGPPSCATRSWPPPRRCPTRSTASGGWPTAGVGAVVLFSLFEEQLREQAGADARTGRRRHRELCRIAGLLPGGRRGGLRPTPLSEPARARRRQRSTCR